MPSVQVSLTVVLAFGLTTLFVLFAIRPTFSTIASLRSDIEESRKLLSSLEKKVSSLNQAATIFEKLQPQLGKIQNTIPNNGADYGQLSRAVEALALDTNVKIDMLAVGESVVSSSISQVFTLSIKQEPVATKLSVRVLGNYNDVVNFYSRLTKGLRLVSIDTLALTREGSARIESEDTVLSLTINGFVYYLADPSSLHEILPEKGK